MSDGAFVAIIAFSAFVGWLAFQVSKDMDQQRSAQRDAAALAQAISELPTTAPRPSVLADQPEDWLTDIEREQLESWFELPAREPRRLA